MMKVKRKQSSQGLTTNSGLCVVLDVSVVRLGRAREVGAGKMLTGIVSMHTLRAAHPGRDDPAGICTR